MAAREVLIFFVFARYMLVAFGWLGLAGRELGVVFNS